MSGVIIGIIASVLVGVAFYFLGKRDGKRYEQRELFD